MAKCSNCKGNINHVVSVETGMVRRYAFTGQEYHFMISVGGEIKYFECPDCGTEIKEIGNNEEKAINFLKEVK